METEKVHELQNPCKELRICLLGKTGVGKSAVGNTILGEEVFKSDLSALSVTQACSKATKKVNGVQVAVIDTPGLLDPTFTLQDTVNRIKLCIPLSAPGPHAFLLVVQPGRFTQEDGEALEIFLKIFGEDASQHTLFLFTHGDRLRQKSVEEFVSGSPDLVSLFNKCKRRYHVFNNSVKDSTQVDQLLEKIEMMSANGGGFYTNKMFQMAERAIEEEKQRILRENEEQTRRQLEALKMTALCEARMEMMERQEKEAREQAEKNNKYIAIIGKLLWEIFEKYITSYNR